MTALGGSISDVTLENLTINCDRFDWFWAGDGQPFRFYNARISELDPQRASPDEAPPILTGWQGDFWKRLNPPLDPLKRLLIEAVATGLGALLHDPVTNAWKRAVASSARSASPSAPRQMPKPLARRHRSRTRPGQRADAGAARLPHAGSRRFRLSKESKQRGGVSVNERHSCGPFVP